MTRNQTLARNRRQRRWRNAIASVRKDWRRFRRKRVLAYLHAERYHGLDRHAIRKSWRAQATTVDPQALLTDLRSLIAECHANYSKPQYVFVPAWPCRNCPHLQPAPPRPPGTIRKDA